MLMTLRSKPVLIVVGILAVLALLYFGANQYYFNHQIELPKLDHIDDGVQKILKFIPESPSNSVGSGGFDFIQRMPSVPRSFGDGLTQSGQLRQRLDHLGKDTPSIIDIASVSTVNMGDLLPLLPLF